MPPTGKTKPISWYLASLIIVALFLVLWLASTTSWKTAREVTPVAMNLTAIKTSSVDFFRDLPLEAKAAAVWDPVTEEIIFAKNPQWQLPLASLTKVMTALLAVESLGADSLVQISSQAIAEEGDSGLLEYEWWRLSNLLDFTLITSSNDGARALALSAASTSGVDIAAEMNRRAESLGMTKTIFKNPTGLDENKEAGALGSASDVVRLFGYIALHHPGLLEATAKKEGVFVSENAIVHRAVNTNSYLGEISGLRGSKTGFTDLSSGNLAIIIDRGLNQPIVIVALASSAEGRFRDVQKLAERTFSYLSPESQ